MGLCFWKVPFNFLSSAAAAIASLEGGQDDQNAGLARIAEQLEKIAEDCRRSCWISFSAKEIIFVLQQK